MSIASTNKKKSGNINQLPQANLHVKILDLVSNRINPYKEGLAFENGDCHTCITTVDKSPKRLSINNNKKQKRSTKKNGYLKTQFPTQSGTITTTHNNSVFQYSRPSLPYIKSPVLIKEAKSPLSLNSKVLSISIDSTKLADLTIDLRGEIEPEFISSKFLCKLKLELIQKQERIKQLQKELQLKVYHIQQLNKDIQCIIELQRRKSQSDNHLDQGQSDKDEVVEPSSLKEMLLFQRISSKGRDSITQREQNNPPENIITNQYDYLLRIIKAQASELQKLTSNDPFNKSRKSISKLT